MLNLLETKRRGAGELGDDLRLGPHRQGARDVRQRKEAVELIELFERGHQAYKQRYWGTAKKIFEDMLCRWPNDGPARLFLGRCEEYLAVEPAADWDGVYVMTHK